MKLYVNGKKQTLDLPENGHFPNGIQLPRPESGGLVILDGKGAKLSFGVNSYGITTPLNEGQSPLTATNTRYQIENFSGLIGGKSAIRLAATFNSVIEQVECANQSEVAVHLGFSLMSRVQNVMVTNPAKDGFYVGIGQFPGWTSVSNAQSNNSVLDQCRVYNAKHTLGNSFTVENSNGIAILNSVAEGHESEGHAIEYRGQNATVKHFLVDGFHIESVHNKGAISIDAQANTSNTLNRVYAQKYNRNVPIVVIKNNAPVRFSEWGWFGNGMFVYSDNFAPRIWAENMPSSFKYDRITTDHISGREIYKPYININGQTPK